MDFKEALSLDININLKNTGEVLVPVVDEVQFFILAFEDKDFFGSDVIGASLIDICGLLVDSENNFNTKEHT